MATINIYPGASDSGTTFSAPNADAYAALSGTVLNTVIWRGGSRFVPIGGKWWGLASKWGLDKPCVHQIDSSYGSDTVILDSWLRFGPSDTAGTWSAPDGLWYIDIFSGGGATPSRIVDKLWVGAVAADTLAGVELGTQYRQAESKAQCGASGLTLAGMLDGDGIWFVEALASDLVTPGSDTCRLWLWTPNGSSQPPVVQWGGLAMSLNRSSGFEGSSTPHRYSPLVVGRGTSSGTNDPSGTIVEAGFVIMGCTSRCTGAHLENQMDAAITDITYNDIRAYAGQYLIRAGSDTAGATITNMTLNGATYDDLIIPEYCPSEDSGGGEVLSLVERAKYFSAFNITATLGATHGIVNFGGPPTTDAEEIITSPIAVGVRGLVRAGSRDARGLSIGNTTDARCSDMLFTGCTTRGHWGGANTLLHSIEWREQQYAATDPDSGRSIADIRNSLDGNWASVSVKARGLVLDRRGDLARGCLEPWTCVEVRSASGGAVGATEIGANTFDIRDSVFLGDAGTAALWYSETTGIPISTTQGWTHNFTNMTVQARLTSPGTTIGVETTIAALTGASAGQTTTDTTNEILRRADRPVRRYGELTLGAVV